MLVSTLLTMLYDYLTLSGDLILLCMAFELYQNQPWVTPKTHLLQASVAAMRKSSTHKNCHRYAVAYFHKVKSIFPINNITLYNRYQQLDATDILSLQVESLKHHIQLYIVQAYDTEYPAEFAKRSEKYAHLLFINQSVEGATVPNSLESPPTSSSILIAQEQLVEDIMTMAENTQTLSSYWSESSRKDLLDWLLPRYLTAVDQRDLLLASCLLHVLLKVSSFSFGLISSSIIHY